MLVIEFCGFVGNDAEIKEFNGQKFISFNVATSERYKDAQGNTVSRTTWVSCLKPGESAVVQYLKKGTQVFVRGDFSAKTFTYGRERRTGWSKLPSKGTSTIGNEAGRRTTSSNASRATGGTSIGATASTGIRW